MQPRKRKKVADWAGIPIIFDNLSPPRLCLNGSMLCFYHVEKTLNLFVGYTPRASIHHAIDNQRESHRAQSSTCTEHILSHIDPPLINDFTVLQVLFCC